MGDTILDKRDVEADKLQLVGITSLYVASKCEEYYPADLKKLVHLTENSYREQDVFDMELVLLGVVHFQVYVPTPADFLPRLCRAALRPSKEFLKTCFFWWTAIYSARSTLPRHHLSSLRRRSSVLGFSTTPLPMKTLRTWLNYGLPPCISIPPIPWSRWFLLCSNYWWVWVIPSTQELAPSTSPDRSTPDWLIIPTWLPKLSRMLMMHYVRSSKIPLDHSRLLLELLAVVLIQECRQLCVRQVMTMIDSPQPVEL